MKRNDRTALMQCLARCRAESAVQAQQIDAMLKDDGWAEAATFAAYHCQSDSLHLLPLESPPCWGDSPHHPDPAANKLLQRMLAAGVSRWHPDPMAALAEAKPKGAA